MYKELINMYRQIQFSSIFDVMILFVEKLLVLKHEFSIKSFAESPVDKKNQIPLQNCLVGPGLMCRLYYLRTFEENFFKTDSSRFKDNCSHTFSSSFVIVIVNVVTTINLATYVMLFAACYM